MAPARASGSASLMCCSSSIGLVEVVAAGEVQGEERQSCQRQGGGGEPGVVDVRLGALQDRGDGEEYGCDDGEHLVLLGAATDLVHQVVDGVSVHDLCPVDLESMLVALRPVLRDDFADDMQDHLVVPVIEPRVIEVAGKRLDRLA